MVLIYQDAKEVITLKLSKYDLLQKKLTFITRDLLNMLKQRFKIN